MPRLAILNNCLNVTDDPGAVEPNWSIVAPLERVRLSTDALNEVLRQHANRLDGGRRANLRGANLSDACLIGATMPAGRTYEAYRADPLAGICDEPEARTRAEAAMAAGGHTWKDCPMHAGLGISGVNEAPADKRIAVAAFVALYDGRQLAGAK